MKTIAECYLGGNLSVSCQQSLPVLLLPLIPPRVWEGTPSVLALLLWHSSHTHLSCTQSTRWKWSPSTKAPLQGLGLSTHFCHCRVQFSIWCCWPARLRAPCLSPACVKLKVSVWMVRQLFSLFQCSRGRDPINLEGTLSPGSRKGHSPQGEGSGETLSLNLPSYMFFFLFKFFFYS